MARWGKSGIQKQLLISNFILQGGAVCGDPGGGAGGVGGGRMTRTLKNVEERARKTSTTVGSILGGGNVAGSSSSSSSSSNMSFTSSGPGSVSMAGGHDNNNFVIDVNDPDEVSVIERNVKKRVARREEVMR